jgi:hypothetical protein
MRAEMEDFPLPLVGLVNIPISNLDNYPPGELASAFGKTDEQQQTDKPTNQ